MGKDLKKRVDEVSKVVGAEKKEKRHIFIIQPDFKGNYVLTHEGKEYTFPTIEEAQQFAMEHNPKRILTISVLEDKKPDESDLS
ncbi:MAG: hypothetical protein HPY68_04645 [Candidatus Atribacteria bacterium]|nr:hypothetical protein [Candidatus Atribacteria bacterium]